MKKVLAIILSICFVLCLTACNKDETLCDVTSGNSQIVSTETQTNTSDESSGSDETNEPNSLDGSSNADNANDSNSSNGSGDLSNNNSSRGKNNSNTANSSSNSNNTNSSNNSSSTNGTNNSSTPTHTHSYSDATCTEPAKCSCGETKGSTLGHKWQDATCKEPKTCSVCKMTEGNKAEHIVDGTVCKFCKQAVPVNSTNIKKREYTIYKFSNIPNEILTFSVDIENGSGSYCNYLPCEEQNGMCPESEDHFNYKNKDYHMFAGSGLGPVTGQNSNNHIIIKIEHYNATLIVEVLSNDTLRVVSISGQLPRELHVGDVFE